MNFYYRLSFMNLVHLGRNPNGELDPFLCLRFSIDLTRPYHIPKWHI